MYLTEIFKKWLIANCDVKETASDDEFKKAAAEAMVAGKLTSEKFAELTKDPKEEEANEFTKKLDGIAEGISKLTEVLSKATEEKPKEKAVETPKEKTVETPKEKATTKETTKMIGERGGTTTAPGEKEFNVRIKEAAENYSTEKSIMVYPNNTKAGKEHRLAGQVVKEFGHVLHDNSDLDKAVAGSWAKLLIATSQRGGSIRFGFEALPQHDKELICYACGEMEWDDSKDGKLSSTKGFPGGYKALIDDAASGGIEAAPIVFDQQVIQTPLLFGELYPLVNTIPLDRGRRVEGVSTGQVTGSWGGVDDTAITLFNTASYVSAFDVTVFRWEGAIQIGLDFLSDTPIDFGQYITQQYGNKLLEDLDDVIAIGNGTTQPEGVMNGTGVSTSAWGGATSLANYEALRFGVSKAEHGPGVRNTAVFCGTETSYERARAIPVVAGDVRRIFGMDYDSYNLMNRPYKINESLANTQVFYAILGRYRMYRRGGFTLRTSTEGDTLVRQNELLIVATARYGGKIERGGMACVTTTAPA